MKYVLDSSVALKWVLNETDSAKALVLRQDFRRRLHELVAPDIFPIEAAHALTRVERRGVIPAGSAELVLGQILNTPANLHSSLVLLPRAVAISSEMHIGVYDCVYVALAEREQCELVTADQKLFNSLRKDFPFLVDLASLP